MTSKIVNIDNLEIPLQNAIQSKGKMFWTLIWSDMSGDKTPLKYLQLVAPDKEDEENWARILWVDKRERATIFTDFNETVKLYRRIFNETQLPVTMAFCGWCVDKEGK